MCSLELVLSYIHSCAAVTDRVPEADQLKN